MDFALSEEQTLIFDMAKGFGAGIIVTTFRRPFLISPDDISTSSAE